MKGRILHMKNFKKIAAIAMTSTLLLTSASVFANDNSENDIMLISSNPDTATYLSVGGLNVSGENVKVIKDENGTMVPLRKVMESLGFTVEWDNDTQTVIMSNLPVYAELHTQEKSFAYGKRAADPVNERFEIIDGTTYVDTKFMEHFDGIASYEDENTVYIDYMHNVTVTSVDEEGYIYVNDPLMSSLNDINGNVSEEGNVRLAVSDETVVTYGNEKYDLKEIKAGDNIDVLYAPMMTMSLPPQVFAQKIVVIK